MLKRLRSSWNATTIVAACAAVAFVVARGAGVDWRTTVVFAVLVLVLLPSVGVFSLPSQYLITPTTAVVTATVGASHPHTALLGAFLVGGCDGFDWRRLAAGRRLIVAFNVSQLGLSAMAAAEVWSLTRHHLELAFPLATLTYLGVNIAFVLPIVVPSSRMGEVLGDLWSTLVADLPFAVSGLSVGLLYRTIGPLALLAFALPMIAARIVMVFLERFRYTFSRLESLYDFTSRLDSQDGERHPIEAMLAQLSSHLGVRSALVLVAVDGGWMSHLLSEDGTTSIDAWTGDLAHAGRTPCLASSIEPSSALLLRMAHVGMADGMAAPLLVEGVVTGWLATSGTPNQRTLTSEDLRLFEALANHAAVFIERNRLVERLRHDSTHDQLTGLPNRSHFLELAAAAARPTTVLLADLDRFKEVNDTLGHDHGDALLVAVADRLSVTFDGAVVARLGGDEFGLLLGCTAPGDAAQSAVELLACLEQPFHVGDFDLEMTASVGVAVAVAAEGTADDVGAKLLQHADIAMYSAKEAHSGWELYSAERDTHSPWRLSMASDLRRGLADELEVHFQPKVYLGDSSVCGVEALVRWRHPRYGLLSPDQFVAVAEQTGLIRPLTMAVLSESCAQQTRLESLGFSLDIAVNLSVRSVLDVSLPDQVAAVLDRHGVGPDRLILEITEGSLMADPARTIGVLGRLASMGISISIDDFGTGYSSLGYLKRLPATEVKIDRSFVSGMLRDRSDDAIVRSTIDLAHNLGLRAVAEGIEDPETWQALGRMGCDLGQGYFMSAPLAAEALLPWLLRNRTENRRG